MSKNTVPLVATGQAIVGVGELTGIVVNSHGSGVIRLVDSPNGTSGRNIFGGDAGYTLPAGSSVIKLENLEYYDGVHFILVSGTANVQLSYKQS